MRWRQVLWAAFVASAVVAGVGYSTTRDSKVGERAALFGLAVLILLVVTRPAKRMRYPPPRDLLEPEGLDAEEPDPSADNSEADNQLLEAAWDGDVGRVRTALAQGAKIECFNRNRHTPLHLAIENMNVDAVRALLEAGANVNSREGWSGWTPLFHAIEIVSDAANQIEQPPDNELVRVLIERGADVNGATAGGETPLSIARRCVNDEAVDLLTAAGAVAVRRA